MLRRAALSRDGRILLATCSIRSFASGAMSVVLGLHLAALGFEAAAIGAIFTVMLAGSAVLTVALTTVSDRLGRRRMLMLAAALMGLAGTLFAQIDQVVLLVVAAILATINPLSRDTGPLPAVEQAILPQTTDAQHRTGAFVAYALARSLSGALGALASGLPATFGLAPPDGYRAVTLAYAAAALPLLLLFARLSPRTEAPPQGRARRFGLHRSRGAVAKLAALFALDSFAGGFTLESLIAYWFHLRYGVEAGALGAIFFGTSVLSALSLLAAAPIARRLGLLNTIVLPHFVSNVFLVLVPLVPSLPLAVAMLLGRHLLSGLDVPTRQSYLMAVVDADERSTATGLTSVARNVAVSIAPSLAGATLAAPALGLPFLIAGGLKIAYDAALLATFHHLRPPEEAAGCP